MDKITWKQLTSILQNPVEYLGSGPKSTQEDMSKRIDSFQFCDFMPNRKFSREQSRDVVLFNAEGRETWLPKKGKVYSYKNTVIIFDDHSTVVYRVI